MGKKAEGGGKREGKRGVREGSQGRGRRRDTKEQRVKEKVALILLVGISIFAS